jgi:hypothetical protein
MLVSDAIPSQHCKVAEDSNGIEVKVNQLTAKKIHDSRKKFAGQKAQSNDQIGFKVDYGRVMDSGNIYLKNCGY